jgi:hypothetical protein
LKEHPVRKVQLVLKAMLVQQALLELPVQLAPKVLQDKWARLVHREQLA